MRHLDGFAHSRKRTFHVSVRVSSALFCTLSVVLLALLALLVLLALLGLLVLIVLIVLLVVLVVSTPLSLPLKARNLCFGICTYVHAYARLCIPSGPWIRGRVVYLL